MTAVAGVRTGVLLILFASVTGVTVSTARMRAEQEHRTARAAMAEAQQTTNPVRLLVLGMQIRGALNAALELDPENLDVRLDLVRFHTIAPRMIGGGSKAARAQAAEIARRDPSLGSFARGYIAYRAKEYGLARRELRESVRTARSPATKTLALKWLGWLSQEMQKYDEAFAVFEELRASDPSALYEIGRTSAFCSCETERGQKALKEYLALHPNDENARKLLGVR